MSLTGSIDLDALPFAGPSPIISGFTMPLPGDKSIPEIDISGCPTSIPRFFDTVYHLGRTAGLADCHIITWARFYAPPREEAIWRHCAKSAGNSYSTFRDAVLRMYPLAQPIHTLQDLRRLVLSTQALPSLTLESFAGFLQDFDRVSGYLLRTGVISTMEDQRMFLEAIPHVYRHELDFSLRLVDPDHAPGVPWPTDTVTNEIRRILQAQRILSHPLFQAPPIEAYFAGSCPPAAYHVQNPLGIHPQAQNQLPTPLASSFNAIRASPVTEWPFQSLQSHTPMSTNALTPSPAPWHAQQSTPAMPSIPSPAAHQAQPTYLAHSQMHSWVPNAFRPDLPATPASRPAVFPASPDDPGMQDITPTPQACTQPPATPCTFMDQQSTFGISHLSATQLQSHQRPNPDIPVHPLPSATLAQLPKHPPVAPQASPESQACSICGFTTHSPTKCPTRRFLLDSGITVADMRGRLMQPDGKSFTRNHPGACVLDRLNHYFARNVNMIPLGLQTPILPLPDDDGITSPAQELPPSHRRNPPRQWGDPQDTSGTSHGSQAMLQTSTTAMTPNRLPETFCDPSSVPYAWKAASPFGTILPKPVHAIPDDPDEPYDSDAPVIRKTKAQKKAYAYQARLYNAASSPPPWKSPAGFPKVSDTPLAPAVIPLQQIGVRLNDTVRVNGVLDSGSSFIGIPRRIWQELKSPACISNPTHIHTVTASPSKSSHIIPSVKISFPGFSIHAPVHILEDAPFDLLLGRPFFTHTRAVTVDQFVDFQTIYLTDPITGEVLLMPTFPRTPPPAT